MSKPHRCPKCHHCPGPRVAPYVPTASSGGRTAPSKKPCGCCHEARKP